MGQHVRDIILASVIVFRKSIADLISRTRRVGRGARVAETDANAATERKASTAVKEPLAETKDTRLEFETLYLTIWGSQILVLMRLNQSELDVAAIREVYDQGEKASPSTYGQYSLDKYIDFLTGQGLIQDVGGNRYRITLKGRTFLLFLTNEGKPLVRPIY